MYAHRVDTAAMMKTARKAMAYESRAARCRSGGSCATSFDECRILLIICTDHHHHHRQRRISQGKGQTPLKEAERDERRTSSAPPPWMRLRSSSVSMDWKSADEMATPPTWPMPRKSCPNPVPTAIASSTDEVLYYQFIVNYVKSEVTYGEGVRAVRLGCWMPVSMSKQHRTQRQLTEHGL